MKAKTIKLVIRKKVDEWLDSIEDANVKKMCADNTIVTGGAIASMLLKEKVSDFDIYFKNKATVLAVVKYYLAKFKEGRKADQHLSGEEVSILWEDVDDRIKLIVKSAGIAAEESMDNYQYFEGLDDAQNTSPGDYVEKAVEGVSEEESEKKPNYRPIFLTSNAITLSNKIQVVIRFYGEPDEIHENYDFVHCMNYWTSWDNHLELRRESLECLLTKELRYIGSKYPLCSIIRTRKFIRRDFSINAGQYLKMVMQLNALDLEDIAVLEDQLVGVDTAYFYDVIQKLKEKNHERVDTAYLMEIIDRIF